MSTRLLPALLALFGALRAQGAWGVAYGPETAAAEPRPALVLLHGMWSSAEEMCSLVEPAAGPRGFLVCPRGNAPLGEGKMWTGGYETVAPAVHRALDAASSMGAGPLDPAGGTLLGYSNGAYFAAEVAMHEPGKWSGLVLLSMHLDLTASRLLAAGIRRVVVGAADQGAHSRGGHGLPRREARRRRPRSPDALREPRPRRPRAPAPTWEARLREAVAWVRP